MFRFSAFTLVLVLLCCGSASAVPLTAPAALPEKPGLADRALELVLTDLADQGPQVIALERELVRRPALNPEVGGQGEEAKALWIESWLREHGLPAAERIDSPDPRVPAQVRPNLIMRHPGASSDTLWLVGHLDVAPAGPEDLWTSSPWTLRADGDLIYGRGVEDNHQCIVAGLLLLETLKRNNITPPLSFGLILTSQAKTYPHPHGLDRVMAARPHLFLGQRNLVVLNDYGNRHGSIIEVTEKGVVTIKVTVHGRQAHGALPQGGLNALAAGARFIVGLDDLNERFPARDPLFDPPQSTFFATRIEAGEAAPNQIPGKCEFFVESRFLPAYQPDEILATFNELARAVETATGTRFTVEPITIIAAAAPTPGDAPVVEALRRAVKKQLGIEPELAGNGAVTLASTLRSAEPPLEVAVWTKADSLGAAVDEHIAVSAILDSARIFARMLFDGPAVLPPPQETR